MLEKTTNFFKSSPEKSLAILLGVIILSFGLVFIALAWTEPTDNPPKGNVAAPINVSGTAQTKSGPLTVGGLTSNGDINLSGNAMKNMSNVYGYVDFHDVVEFGDSKLKNVEAYNDFDMRGNGITFTGGFSDSDNYIDSNTVSFTNFKDGSGGEIDFRSGLNMNGNRLKGLRNVYGDGGSDILFRDRPQSRDGLYIRNGVAYFNNDIRVDHIQDRGGGNTIYSDSHWDWNNHDLWDVNQLATDYLYKAGGGNIHMRDNINFDNRNIYNAHVIKSDYFYYTSDKRLKENIVPLEDSLNKVMNLKGVSFDWRKEEGSSIGLIAQDLEKEFPKAVATDEETGMKSINYGVLTAPLIESVKAQQKQIEELKEESENQQRQIDQLQKEIEQIKEEIE